MKNIKLYLWLRGDLYIMYYLSLSGIYQYSKYIQKENMSYFIIFRAIIEINIKQNIQMYQYLEIQKTINYLAIYINNLVFSILIQGT